MGLTEVRSQDERGILGRNGPVAKVSGAALIIARARGAVGAEAALRVGKRRPLVERAQEHIRDCLCNNIAAIWVAFFSGCQRYDRC